MKIAVSYLSSPHDPQRTIALIDKSNADFIHVDLMDGKYVPNKNFTMKQIKNLFGQTKKKLSIHLMCEKPEQYIADLALLNTDCIIFHPRTTRNPFNLINDIKDLGIRVGIAINPDEELELFEVYWKYVDEILVMSVKPGAGGQPFMKSVLPKIEKLSLLKKQYNFLISVDGGVNNETASLIQNVDVIVSGAYICHSQNYDLAIDSLRL